MDRINVGALTITIGLTLAIGAVIMGWMAAFFGWGTELVILSSNLYVGYAPTFIGGIIGGIWAFIDGAITGALIATFYNYFAK